MSGPTPGPVPVGLGRWAVPGNRWDLAQHLPAPAELPEISVVVPYFENQAGLDQVLTGLALQTHPMRRLQVVVADDGSRAAPTVPESASALSVVVVRQQDLGFRAGAARNLGVAASDGSLLAFLDGDTVPTPSYLEHLSRLPTLLPEAVVGGRRRYGRLTRWPAERVARWLTTGSDGPDEIAGPRWLTETYQRTGDLLRCGSRGYTFLIGAVLGCTREFFDELGGFDESIVGYGGEDYDFTYRAWNLGGVLAHVPDAVAWHDGPDWSGRTAPEDQAAAKNREIMMLAERIPEPGTRGTGQIYRQPDVVVTLDVAGWTFGAAVRCVRSLLSQLDCGVWLDDASAGEDLGQLVRAFMEDPRVRVAPVEPRLLARARVRVRFTAPALVDERFAAVVVEIIERDLGPIRVLDAFGSSVATVQTTRSAARAARWRSGAPGAQWFSHGSRAASDAGIRVVADEPSLSAVFGGWA